MVLAIRTGLCLLAVIVMGAGALAAGSASQPSDLTPWRVEETALGTLHKDRSDQIMTRDGRHFLYIARDNEQSSLIVVDGKVAGKIDGDLVRGSLTSSGDASRIAYAVKDEGKPWAVIDGKAGNKFDEVGSIRISDDGKRTAYLARDGDKWSAVVDGQAGPTFASAFGLTISPDGKRWAYFGKDKAWQVMVDGKKTGPERAWVDDLRFSPDSQRWVYRFSEDKKWCVVVDGKDGPKFENVGVPIFSPDSRRVAYAAKEGGKSFVVTDGTAGPNFPNVDLPVFSADGRRVAYRVKDGEKTTYAVDGRTVSPEEYSRVTAPPGPPQPASRQGPPGRSFILHGGWKGPLYEQVLPNGPACLPDGVVEYLAIKSGALYRVRHVPK